MPLELTEQQRQALTDRPLGPVQLIDPATQRVYVLIAAEQFQRVADFLAPELTASQCPSPDPSELIEVEDVDFGLCEFDDEEDVPLAI